MIGCLGEKVERLFGSCVGRWFGRWFGGGLEAGWEVVWRLGEASGEVPGEVSGEVPGEVSGRAPWVQFADRLGEQKCCVFTVYRGLGGVMQEHAEGRGRTQPETSPALINLPKPKGKATALGHAPRAQGTVADFTLTLPLPYLYPTLPYPPRDNAPLCPRVLPNYCLGHPIFLYGLGIAPVT